MIKHQKIEIDVSSDTGQHRFDRLIEYNVKAVINVAAYTKNSDGEITFLNVVVGKTSIKINNQEVFPTDFDLVIIYPQQSARNDLMEIYIPVSNGSRITGTIVNALGANSFCFDLTLEY